MDHQLHQLLHTHDLRDTPPRQIVFRALNAGPAITIQELTAKTAKQLDRASLYRTLNLFRELGVVKDVVIAGQRKLELTDIFSPHHHHIACSNCGRTVSIHDDGFERHIEQLAAAEGFTHESHSFEITGLCAQCLRR